MADHYATKLLVTRTPPRTTYVVGGKRDCPASPPSFTSTGDSMVNTGQVISCHPGDHIHGNNNTVSSFFVPYSSLHSQDGFLLSNAVTVSPFMDRLVDVAAPRSLVDDTMNNITNNHLETVPEEQTHCTTSIDDHNSNSQPTFEAVTDDVIYYSNLPDCPPPSKRARLEDDTTQHSSSLLSITTNNDVDMLLDSGSSLPPLSPKVSCKTSFLRSELLTTSDSSSSNNDEGLVIRCCHVCSLEDHGEKYYY